MIEQDYLLDTSALLTLIEDEPGADRVEEVIASGRAIVPAMALMEVFYISMRKRGISEAARRYGMLTNLEMEIVWKLDEVALLWASTFKANHRLSFADAWNAAFAQRRQAVLLHKDPEFVALEGSIDCERLPFKATTG